jgi:fumarylacetoacetate (FAA) hydrolase
MKLATYKDGSRDGQLVVVSRDLSTAHYATGIATRLQQVLDDWNFLSPQLEDLATTLNHGKARHAFAFDPAMCMAPLPRVHTRLVADPAARGTPRLRAAAGAGLLGARDDFWLPDPSETAEPAPGLAVLTGDIAAGAAPAQALEGVRLLLLAVEWSLPARADAAEVEACPTAGFGAVAVTPDELGADWAGGRARLTLQQRRSGGATQSVDAAEGLHFHFGQLLAAAARTRPLAAGTLLGSGGLYPAELLPGAGLPAGGVLRLDAKGADGHSVFGVLEQGVTEPQ